MVVIEAQVLADVDVCDVGPGVQERICVPVVEADVSKACPPGDVYLGRESPPESVLKGFLSCGPGETTRVKLLEHVAARILDANLKTVLA